MVDLESHGIEIIVCSGKWWEVKVNFVRLVTAECQKQGEYKTSVRVNINELSLTQFKRLLRDYYTADLWTCYNVEDPRTWKTICLKCNYAHTLLTSLVTCCF